MSSSPRDDAFIRLRDVSKRYQMGSTPVHALDSVTLDLPQGQFVAITGPSGSGKSTLLHLLAALDTPTSGSVAVGEWQLGALDRDAQAAYRRSMVGIVFQQFHLVPTMTARQNVALPLILAGVAPEVRQPRADECLAIVGLADRADHRPSELSGGEQQRVAIARALAPDPPVLLADEPTGNLDADTGAQIVHLLEDVHRDQGRTVIVVTHHFAEVEAVTERRIQLRDGRVANDRARAPSTEAA